MRSTAPLALAMSTPAAPAPARACQNCALPFNPRAPYAPDYHGAVANSALYCLPCETATLAQWAPLAPSGAHPSI